MTTPLISVILPTYKRPEKLDRAINSVLNQTYDNWELFVIDDNNQGDKFREETSEFMENYITFDNIKYIKHQQNQGGSAARNTGIKKAAGEYIAFLDDDDEWMPEKLEMSINKLEAAPVEYGVCFSNYYVVTSKRTFMPLRKKAVGDIYKQQLIQDHASPTSAVVAKQECFEKVGLFDTSLPARQDYDMWIRLARYYKFTHIKKPLVYIYRKTAGKYKAISSNYKNSLQGTEIILDKIKDQLKEFNKKFEKKVYSSQYRYLGKKCCNFEDYNQGKKYFWQSLNYKIEFKTIVFLILASLGSKVWNGFRKLKRKLGELGR